MTIFKNNSSSKLVEEVQSHNALKNLGVMVRFNSTDVTDSWHKLTVRSSSTKMKVFMTIYPDRLLLVAYNKCANKPFNVIKDYTLEDSLILPATHPNIVQDVALFIAKTLSRKSDFLLDMESGSDGYLKHTFNWKECDDTNVYVGCIKTMVVTPDSTSLKLDTGMIVKITESDQEKIPSNGNIVGRYVIMNCRKEFIIVAWPILQQKIRIEKWPL